MYQAFSLVSGASLGVGLMFLLDPDRAKRRRTSIRAKNIRWSRDTRWSGAKTSRGTSNRPMGMDERAESWAQSGPRATVNQTHWSPTRRLAAAVMGGSALLYGMNRRTVGASTLAASGLGLLLRSATNQELARLFNFSDSVEREEFKKAA